MLAETTQRNQPEGVPPLSLTGERTLPDVPAENYWYRRHLVVYHWIAERCRGLDVVDLACGEGYGTDVLAADAARVTGVDANPEALRARTAEVHASGRAVRARPRGDLRRALRRRGVPADDRARAEPGRAPRPPQVAAPPGRRRVRDHAQRAHSRARRREVRQPLAREGVPRRGVPRRCARRSFGQSSCSASSTRASCASTSSRSSAAGTTCTRSSASPSRFYEWFTPAISERDFALKPAPLDRALDFLAVLR